MEKNSEDKIVETFAQTLRIVNSNTIPRISFISKYNKWSKQFETGFKTLTKTKENLKFSLSPNRYLRFSVTSLITLCFLESIRCKSTTCCLTGIAFFTFLISWNLLTAVFADISKHDESIDSIIYYVESLMNLCKIITYKLNRTRQIFKIIAGPNFLHTIPGCYKSSVRFKFYNVLHSWLHFCLSWFDVFGILIAVQISIVLYVLELPDFPKVLQCLSGMGTLLVAFLQHRKSKRSREKIQQTRLFLNSITSEYFQWFQKKCRLRTFMMELGYLDLDVQECLHRRFSIFKNNAQSHLMSAVVAVGVAYGLQYEIREEFLSDAVRYFLFNKRPKQNHITKQKIEVKEQSVLQTSIKKEPNSYRDLFGKFTNLITSQRVTSNLPAVVPKEDHLTKHGNVTSNECGIRSDAVSNSSEVDGKKFAIESEEDNEIFTLCPLPSPDSLEHKKQEDLEPVKVVEFKDIGQLEEKALEVNQNNYNQETSINANILQMATVSSVDEPPDQVLQQSDSVALSDCSPCLFSNAKSSLNQPDINADNLSFNVTDEDRVCHFEWNRLKTNKKVINKFELNDMVKNRDCCSIWNQCQASEGYTNHADIFSDVPLLNDTVGNLKCCRFIWNRCQTARRYLTKSSSESLQINNSLGNCECCQFIWNHCQPFESYLNQTDNTEVDAKSNNAEANHYVTETYDIPSSSTLRDECRIAKNSGKDTPSNPNCEEEDFRIIQDSENEKVFKDTTPYHQTGPVSLNQYGECNRRNYNDIITGLERENVCNLNMNMRHAENSLREPDSRGSIHPAPSSERKDNPENEKKITPISNSLLEHCSKNNQPSLQLTNKIEENNTYFSNSKERRKRTRNAKKRWHNNYPSSSEDESPNKVRVKISDCLNVKRIRKLSLCKFTKKKIKQEEDATKPRSRILQLHQQKLLEMRRGYDIQEMEEENSHYLFLSHKKDLNNVKLGSTLVTSSIPTNEPQSTFASNWATNNQFKFESSPANNNQSMSLPAFVRDNQSVFIPTQNSDMKVSTLPSDNHSVIEASPNTNNLPTESHLMIFKARNTVPLDHRPFKENTQAYFKNYTSVSTQTKDSNLTVASYKECELPCASSPSRYSDREALTTGKENHQQPNGFLKHFETSLEDYISEAEISGSSSYSLNQTEDKLSFQLLTDTNNQRPINFGYANNYSSFGQGTSNTQQHVFTQSSDLEDKKTDPKLDLCETDKQIELPGNTNLSQSDLTITKGASALIDTAGLSEDNISLTSNKSPDTAADKNYFRLKKRRTSMSEIEGTVGPSNGMEQSLQALMQSKSSTKPKKSNMQWESDINVNRDPVSDLEKGALQEDFTDPEYDQSPPANLTEPLTYSLKCGNMNLQFTENAPHVTLRFICENNEDITEQKVTKHQISKSESGGDEEFVIPKHEQVHVLEGSTANNEMSFTINSANGDLISKSTNLKNLDGVPCTMEETRLSSSSFQSEPSSSESSSAESDSCSESDPIPEADQTPLTTGGHIEEIPIAVNEAVDGDTNQDLHFETDNVKLDFVPTSNSGTLQISYRQSFGHNRLIFKSNDKKLKLKTKK